MITAVVVGCGDRATVYVESAYELGDFKVVAAVDPDPERRRYYHEKFGVEERSLYADMSAVLKKGKIADCVINGTMDKLHVETAVPFLEQGYDMLLEKPISTSEDGLLKIRDAARKSGSKLMICHVLRYAPFYRKAKELILSGEIGEIMHIETTERVGIYHSSVSYIRGKWNNEEECGSGMLLAKCCHDLDLISWFNNTTKPVMVSSFGGRNFFIPEKAPAGSGTRCMVDCPAEIREKCNFEAEEMYMHHDVLPWYPWQCTGKNYQDVTEEEKRQSLLTYNPHGRCIYKTNADIVDHQALMVQFANGSTATHSMITASEVPTRKLYIKGTSGELEGGAGGVIILRKYDKRLGCSVEQEVNVADTAADNRGHYGGDSRLVKDFISLMHGEQPSISCTSIEDSITGHLIGFKAEESRKKGKTVKM